ncbi:MAG: hypothetical protein GX259_03580 [Bacteroidales bacterium]|nr:hypothetical protein [Bacteroidales bacterium]
MECTTLDLIKTIAISGTSVVAIFTLIKGYSEYKLTTKQRRIELYEIYRRKLKEDETIRSVVDALENDNGNIVEISRIDKYMFLGFYEDIALLMNTGLIKPEIAHYMFGYYAMRCWENESFWNDINRNSHYWRVFREFVEKMKDLENSKKTIPSNKKIKFKI